MTAGVLEGVGVEIVAAPEQADFVLNTGPYDERETADLGSFVDELTACLRANLKMICANPDLEIVRGDQRILCAGTFAAWYAAQGGDVRWIGKPDAAIYRRALAMLTVPARARAGGRRLAAHRYRGRGRYGAGQRLGAQRHSRRGAGRRSGTRGSRGRRGWGRAGGGVGSIFVVSTKEIRPGLCPGPAGA